MTWEKFIEELSALDLTRADFARIVGKTPQAITAWKVSGRVNNNAVMPLLRAWKAHPEILEAELNRIYARQ